MAIDKVGGLRAYERNEGAIMRWLKQEYPAIARQARRDKAAIYWGDERGCAATTSRVELCPGGTNPQDSGY